MNKLELQCGCESKEYADFYCELHDSFICIHCKIQAHIGCACHITSITVAEMTKPLLEDLIHCVDVIKSVWKNIPSHNRCENEYDYVDIAQETISQFRSEYETHEKLISNMKLSKDNSLRYTREMVLLSKQMIAFKNDLMDSEIWKSAANHLIQCLNKDSNSQMLIDKLKSSHLKEQKKTIKNFEKKIKELSNENNKKSQLVIDLSIKNDSDKNEIAALKLFIDELKLNDGVRVKEIDNLKIQLHNERVKIAQLNNHLIKLENQVTKQNKIIEEQKKCEVLNENLVKLTNELKVLQLPTEAIEERKENNNLEATERNMSKSNKDKINLIIDVEEKTDEVFSKLEKFKLPKLRKLTTILQ